MRIASAFRTAVALAAIAAPPAAAQSMTPMRGKVSSMSDEFALRVTPRNVYDRPIVFEMKAYDENFRPIRAAIAPARFAVGPQGARSVTVLVGFDGRAERKVRICAESVPFPEKNSLIRTRICGRFVASRL